MDSLADLWLRISCRTIMPSRHFIAAPRLRATAWEIRGDRNDLTARRCGTQELRSGCRRRHGPQLRASGRRIDECLPWRDAASRHAEQASMFTRAWHCERHGNGPAARGPPHGRIGPCDATCIRIRREHRVPAQHFCPGSPTDYDKIPAERVLMNDRELPGTVLRLPMIYGPGDPLPPFLSGGEAHPRQAAAHHFSRTRSRHGIRRGATWENVAAAISHWARSDERAAGRIYNVWRGALVQRTRMGAPRSQLPMSWDGEFVVLPAEQTPPHLKRPGNTAQHWTATSARIRKELEYREPVAIDEAIRKTIRLGTRKSPRWRHPLAQFRLCRGRCGDSWPP